MTRIRFFFAKRGTAIFIPHVELPTLFARAARRGGIKICYSEGFHPRPRISLGAPLPVGVVALGEAGELYAETWDPSLGEAFIRECPGGIDCFSFVLMDGKSLGKECGGGSYLLRGRSSEAHERMGAYLREEEHQEACRISDFREGEEGHTFLLDERNSGLGRLVKRCVAHEVVRGWEELFLLRTAVGALEEGNFRPLRGFPEEIAAGKTEA